MPQEQYISVSEFAKALGVSTQSVYKRMATDLQPFVKKLQNKKVISTKAFEEIYNKKMSTDFTTDFKQVDKVATEEIQFLRKQIENLTEELKSEREHNRELQDKLMVTLNNLSATPLLEQQNQLADKVVQEQHLPENKPKGFFGRLKYLMRGEQND